MKFLIVGAGAVGAYIGALMARGLKLGAEGTGSVNDVETNIRYRTVDLRQPPPATVERASNTLGWNRSHRHR